MESVDMDISTSDKDEEEDEDEDDDGEDVAKLLSCLNGIEKCFLRVNNESGKTVTAPEKKPDPNGNDSNKVSKENRTETSLKTTISTKHDVVIESNQINYTNYPVVAVSPTSSNASTLSRESTPEKQLSHCPKDCDNNNSGQSPKRTVTIAQLLDKDSDDDVIIENIDEYRKTLEAKSDSDHSDITYMGTNSGVLAADTKSSEESTLLRNPDASTIGTDSVLLDSTARSSTKSNQREGEPLTTVPTVPQPEQTDKHPAKDDESDSDCLIVEHIAASDHLQNGLIDLTKPTSDEEASLPLQERTEESLLKEISKIRKALTKHSKKHKKEKKKHKSHKKKKRSKSKGRAKSPSLDKVSESDNENDENESRTILLSDSGVLRVNITTTIDNSKTDSDDSNYSSKTNKSKTTIPPESEGNLRSSSKDSNCNGNPSSAKENETEADNSLENPNLEDKVESGELPENPGSENEADGEESPPLWNSDCEDTVNYEKFNAPTPPPAPVFGPAPTTIEWNPLKRKLSSFNDNFNTRQPLKKIFCESSKELMSKFRRNAKRNFKRKAPFVKNSKFDKTNKFIRYLSQSDDSDSSNKKPPQRVPSVDKFNKFTIDSDSDKSSDSIAGKKFRKVADSDTDNALRRKSPAYSIFDTVCNFNRGRFKSIQNDTYRSNRSRSLFKSKSRSPICYRRSPSSYRNSPHSRRRISRHKTSAREPDYDFRLSSPSYSPPIEMPRSPSRSHRSPSRSHRNKSSALRSPSRSRRSRSRVYTSPSRSHRSKSRTYRSPCRSRRSRSRTYRSPSRSHRSISRRRTPRRRSESRSPSEIRAARKWSPLEDMRQQLKKNNEVAVQQALGGLEKPKKKAPEARIIDDVDLTNSPTPEPSFVAMTASASVTTQAVVSQLPSQMHPYNAAALPQNYPVFLGFFDAVRPRDFRPQSNFMPMPILRAPGILNQTGIFQISHVYSQAVGPPDSYVPMYSQPHPPYM